MKLLVIRLFSLAWAKVSAQSVYPPVICAYAALTYLNLAASLIVSLACPLIVKSLLIWCPDLNHNAVLLVVAAVGTAVAYVSLFLGLAGCVMCRANRGSAPGHRVSC